MLTPETIANKTFRRTLLGYDLEQVDDFLDEILLHLQQLEKERKEMSDTIEHLSAEIRRLTPDNGHAPEPEEEIAFPVSPHTLVVSQPLQQKAVKGKAKKAKTVKSEEPEKEKKPAWEEKRGKGKKVVKRKKVDKPVTLEKIEQPEQPPKSPAVKETQAQEETIRFRLPTKREEPVEVPVVEEPVEEAPAREEAVIEPPVVDEIVAEEPIGEEPVVEEPESPVSEEVIEKEPEPVEQPEPLEQSEEEAHEQE